MDPRITISINKNGDIEICLNPKGRDLLVRELQGLNQTWDHFHLGPKKFDGELPVQSIPYCEGERIIEWGKVLFRSDTWDTKYFPHVLAVVNKND